ncbi:hypothetical protein PVAP13_4KG384200 [Panicum virgatum]|uniref:RING-type E3 ubiquitin transferase n=1 Tax=Panicum virgatum TaxID=38727 RepID=A0A8T0TXF1_PANVG|nr:hypothetical protein PVAP13_4KG384200 [Panicum virgatum]
MDESSGRSATPVGFLRRGSGISLRNQSNENRPSQYNNKPGKNTNLNPVKARFTENKEKPKYLHGPFHSSGSKASSVSSSKAPVRKYQGERPKRPFLAEADVAESSNRRTEVRRLQSGKEAVVYEDGHPYTQRSTSEGSSSSTFTDGGLPEEHDLGVLEFSVSSGSCAHTVDSRNTALSAMQHRQNDREELNSGRPQGASSFVHRSVVPQSLTTGVKLSSAHGATSTSLQRHGLKGLGCTSITDVLPSGCSSSDSVHNRRVEVMKNGTSDAARSSRSRGISGQSNLGQPRSGYPGYTGPRARAAEQSARTNSTSIRDSTDSVRTRRPSTLRARERMPGEREDSVFALRETVTRVHHPERDGYRHINMDGISEVLLALDRIEHDDELTYERLLVLETNLLLSGLGLHDQHQDMRLDIDNMSYEELLALEEHIGSVSTALTEEQFAKWVNQSVYKAKKSDRDVNKITVDDVKCSICQEEYNEGEVIGRMQCEHQYHVCCIHEWLRQKNWCPICKASAIPGDP